VYAVVLKRSDHFETGAVAHMGQPWIPVSAEISLVDKSFFRTVEDSAPGLKEPNAFRGEFGMEFGHAPDIEEFSTPHGITEVDFPMIALIHIGKGSGYASFGHDRMGLPQERFHYDTRAHPPGRRFNGSAEGGSPGPHDKYIVFNGL
jgi:hypothetical protein